MTAQLFRVTVIAGMLEKRGFQISCTYQYFWRGSEQQPWPAGRWTGQAWHGWPTVSPHLERCPQEIYNNISLARYMNTQHSILKSQYSIFSTAEPWFQQRISDKPNYPPCPIMRVKLNEWLNNSHLPSTFKFQFILVWAWALVPLVQIALQKNNL